MPHPDFSIPDYGPYHDYPTKPIGGGNPYYCCAACERSDPQINGTLSGHNPDCQWVENKKRELAATYQAATIRKLVTTLQESDPDALLENHAEILTPDEVWAACDQDVGTALQYSKRCPQIIGFLAENHPDELVEQSPNLPLNILETLIQKKPGLCLEYLELTPEQRMQCIHADILAGAEYAPEDLTAGQVEDVIRTHPKTALLCLHSRLDDTTFNHLVDTYPDTAWRSNPHRLSGEFLEKHLVNGTTQTLYEAWQLSREQIKWLATTHPKFARGKLRNTLPANIRKLIPDDEPVASNTPKKKIPAMLWFLLGIATAAIAAVLFR